MQKLTLLKRLIPIKLSHATTTYSRTIKHASRNIVKIWKYLNQSIKKYIYIHFNKNKKRKSSFIKRNNFNNFKFENSKGYKLNALVNLFFQKISSIISLLNFILKITNFSSKYMFKYYF